MATILSGCLLTGAEMNVCLYLEFQCRCGRYVSQDYKSQTIVRYSSVHTFNIHAVRSIYYRAVEPT